MGWEVFKLFPLFGLGGLGREQRIVEAVVLGAVHGAVDVVRRSLVPARGKVNAIHVDGFGVDDGRDGIVKRQVAGARDALDLRAQSV